MVPQLSPDISFSENDVFWRAVIQRDARFDGVFVYAVASTRIFCRPTCAAKRPKRENVQFWADANRAIAHGFRACKRCRPQNDFNAKNELVRRVCALIESGSDASLKHLSLKTGVSATHLQRTFKNTTGISPREFANQKRINQLKTGLHHADRVLDAQNDAGFGSSRGLYQNAPSQLGMTPATYKKGGAGAQIRFAIAPCSLGFLLVAATVKGICSVALGDASDRLESALRREFPNAAIAQDENVLREQVEITLRVLDGENIAAKLPLDIQATAFQRRVWQVLQQLKRGETLSYAQLAQRIGQPAAARAVAQACATNPVALLVPCHRIVGKNGALSGYRWGIERKQKLLQAEADGQK